MADTVREFTIEAITQYHDKLNTDILSTKEVAANKVTSISSSSTDTQYPSAKAVQSKINTLDGTATIATVSNNVVTLKTGISETDGIISNSSGTDITLHKIASTGSPNDINVTYNGENVSLQTALANIKTGIDNAASAGTQYIVSNSRATTPNVAQYNNQTGTLSPSSTTAGKVYLVPDGTDSYTQYITTQSGSTYSWTSLGSTTVDLSGVAKIITLNGKQYAVSEGTTLIDLGNVITEVNGQTAITNANTNYVHTVATTTINSSTGSNSVNLETQVKLGSVTNNSAGIAEATDVKANLDNKIIIRTWTAS